MTRVAAPEAAPRRVGLVLRVSTDRQANTPEGSLVTQAQRLREHLAYRRETLGEAWEEAAVYELRAVSGKDSLRSPEFGQLFADIEAGRINTVLCTALDRICRSVRDFLHFFEVLNAHDVEFVCLKQNYDTTSPQGRLFVTIMMALAEFEREQTAERTRDATAARSARGLWNGGQLLGYDLDAHRKGFLIPNESEAVVVQCAFVTYLECGSIADTARRLNRQGYRTKRYTSRRGRHHPGTQFSTTSVQHTLKNVAYIGKKRITRTPEGDQAPEAWVDAVWPGIVDPTIFARVQELMAANGRSHHNGAKPLRHVHLLSRGLLFCGRCTTAMESRSGTGRLGKTYFYYVCPQKSCGMRVAAEAIESAVRDRVRELAGDVTLVQRLVEATNATLQVQAPLLKQRRRIAQEQLATIRGRADRLLADWEESGSAAGQTFVQERLDALGQQRLDLESTLGEIDQELAAIDLDAVDAETVQRALAQVDVIYEHLKPFEQKELVRLLVRRVELHDEEIVLELFAGAAVSVREEKGPARFGPPEWLPE